MAIDGMLLTGNFVRQLDEKQRIAVPKPLREALAAPAADSSLVLYITPGMDGSLFVYNTEALEGLATRLGRGSPAAVDGRTFGRLFYSQIERVEVDGQGRIRLSAESVKWAGITAEVTLLGVGDQMEIWDRARWEAYWQTNQAAYDTLAEAAFATPQDANRIRST